MTQLYQKKKNSSFWVLLSIIGCCLYTFPAEGAQEEKPAFYTSPELSMLPLKARILLKKLKKEGKYDREIMRYYEYGPSKTTYNFLWAAIAIFVPIPVYTIAFFFDEVPSIFTDDFWNWTLLIVLNVVYVLLYLFQIIVYTNNTNVGGIALLNTGIAFIKYGLSKKEVFVPYEDIVLLSIGNKIQIRVKNNYAFAYFNHIKNDSKIISLQLEREKMNYASFKDLSLNLHQIFVDIRYNISKEKLKKDLQVAQEKILKKRELQQENPSIDYEPSIYEYFPEPFKKQLDKILGKTDSLFTKMISYYPFRKIRLKDAVSVLVGFFFSFIIMLVSVYSLIIGVGMEAGAFLLLGACASLHFGKKLSDYFGGKKFSGYLLTDKGLLIIPFKQPDSYLFFPYDSLSLMILLSSGDAVNLLGSSEIQFKKLYTLYEKEMWSFQEFHELLEALQVKILEANPDLIFIGK